MCNCCNSCTNTHRCGCYCQNGSTSNNGSSNCYQNANFGTPAFGLFVPVSFNPSNGSNGSNGSSCYRRCGTVNVSCCNGTSVRVTCGGGRGGCCNGGCFGSNQNNILSTNSNGDNTNGYDAYYARQYGLNTVGSRCGYGYTM